MYINGLYLRTIACLLHTSATSVLSWARKFALENYEKPQPSSEAVVIQLDEIWHFLNLKNKLWIWKAYYVDTRQLIDWECGNRDTNTLKKLLQRLKKWNVRIYIIDYWKPYAEIIPKELLLQNKKYTHSIERNNSHQRHWFARFRRKICVVSRSLEMVDFNHDSFC